MERVILIWPGDRPDELSEAEAEFETAAVESGVVEVDGPSSVGEPGTYRRLDREAEALLVLELEYPAAVFLHDDLRAQTETWVEPIAGLHEETDAVIRARDAVQQMMQSHLDSGVAVRTSRTVTSTEDTARGLAVVGRGLFYRRSGKVD